MSGLGLGAGFGAHLDDAHALHHLVGELDALVGHLEALDLRLEVDLEHGRLARHGEAQREDAREEAAQG